MMNLDGFNSLFELINTFSSEQKCIEYLESIRWKGTVISPFDSTSKVYKCSNGNYWCKSTNKLFNVKHQTIFENSKVPLQKWFMAIWLISSHKKGISSVQLSKDIDVTQKTGWFMLQRIRKCLSDNSFMLHNEVEVDETYIGGRERNKAVNNKTKGAQGRSTKTKTAVIGMIERKGRLVSHIIENAKSATLTSAVLNAVDKNATVYTDEWKGYSTVDRLYHHLFVKHKQTEFANGNIYTNNIECFWGLLKRSLLGTYHNASKKHLQMYIDEFVFRYNTRNISEVERFNLLLTNTQHRLKYRDLIVQKI